MTDVHAIKGMMLMEEGQNEKDQIKKSVYSS
jgi:hypothetical protein